MFWEGYFLESWFLVQSHVDLVLDGGDPMLHLGNYRTGFGEIEADGHGYRGEGVLGEEGRQDVRLGFGGDVVAMDQFSLGESLANVGVF